jgi:sterol desaturase/sphingolipid hydroxylase (fatty acid hydroxylase superfamily)
VTPAERATLLAIAASAALLVLLERLFPYNRGQRLLRTGFFTDFLFYNFFQSWICGVLIGRFLAWTDAHASLSRPGFFRGWPLALQVALFVVSHDLYIYLFHRLQHRSPLLWRIHEAHHSVPEVDWLSGVRSHTLEILINQTIEFAPIVLLGAGPAVAPIKGAISAIWGMFIHSNVDVRLGILQRFFNGPEMHRWHHALDPEAQGKNFGTKLAIWDWLFGTAYLPDPRVKKAARYGIADPGFPESFPWGWARQHAYAFRRGA